MPRHPAVAVLISASLVVVTGCRVHLRQDPPAIPPAFVDFNENDLNAGRVQSISVSPVERNRALVAMEFGGLWGTTNGGENWFRIFSLPAVMMGDVEFGADGTTVVATVFRDNQVTNGGGIYVSHDKGGTWTRPPTGIVPAAPFIPRTSAYGVSQAPDVPGLWYVGTDFGVAISTDNGNTWTHKKLETTSPPMVQATLGFPGGQVLALATNGLYRSDDRGGTWRKVLTDSFNFYFNYGVNKMDRSPYSPWAFILREYRWGSPEVRGGTMWFYELDTGTQTLLQTPQGNSRGPFVRVTKERGPEFGPWPISIWTGHGWDGWRVTRATVEEFRALTPADWVSYIATAGIHADMSDLGVDAGWNPVFLGSDGGLFKPRPPSVPGNRDWISAAAPGSGMNSLQITDLAGTNMRRPDGAVLSTSLYFGTQDNNLWASADGGKTWPGQDEAEGYDLEVRNEARPGEPITVGYVEIGEDWTEQLADANFLNQRAVADVDQNGQPLDKGEMKQAFYLEPTAGGTKTGWLRLRIGPWPNGVYVSMNSGDTWRRRFDLNFGWPGAAERTNLRGGVITEGAAARVAPDVAGLPREGIMVWLPVDLGSGGIGLVLLSNLYADRVDTIDDSDAVRLPGNGSLGLRGAQWDFHAVFGVDPYDWQFLIAPDIVAGDVKVSRDGGQTWVKDEKLTAQVLKGGALKMRDIDDYHMQVTKIAFDPYHEGRILVGTRDAGVICTIDDGKTWRTITNSDRISYVTGFHFYPNGAVHIASWGHGIWYLDRTSGCSKTDPPYWGRRPPVGEVEPTGGVLARTQPREPPAPRGEAYPGVAKLNVWTAQPSSGVAGLGPDNTIQVAGRGFPAAANVTLRFRAEDPRPLREEEPPMEIVQAGKDGMFSARVELPEDLPHGVYVIEAVAGLEGKVLAVADFIKSFGDEPPPRDGGPK